MKNPKIILAVGAVIIIILGGVFFATSKNKSTTKTQSEITPTEVLIPTVDSSVKVELEPINSSKEILLKITGLPRGTSTVEYSLSYMTKSQGLQGVIGTITLDMAADNYEKKLTLGTCSSGTCVYHEVAGSIKTELKFSGTYGDKVLTKEFTLN